MTDTPEDDTDTPEDDKATSLTDQIKAHPGIAIASGLALGVVVAALLPRGSVRRLAKGAVAAATVGTEAGLELARQAREKAEAAASEAVVTLHAAEDSAGEGLRRLRRGAAKAAGTTRNTGLDLAHAAIRLLGALRR
jgi:hypothetical protein